MQVHNVYLKYVGIAGGAHLAYHLLERLQIWPMLGLLAE